MVENTLNLKEILKTGKFIVKWGGEGFTGVDNVNKMSPGWMLETQDDTLLTRIDESTSIMKDATFIKMDSRQHALDYLYVRPKLQSMSTDGGMLNKELSELTETTPLFARRELDAKPFVAYTYTPKQFIWENIQKEKFLQQYEGLLAEACGTSAESIAMYGVKSTTDKTGYGDFDGIFKQLEDISKLTEEEEIRENGKGYFGVVDKTPTEGNIVEQLMDMITSFADQKGNIDKAVIYTSTVFRGALLKEASRRETDLGDSLYVNGNDISVFGIPIRTAGFINKPENGFNEKIIICDPKSIVFGFVQNIESESTYEHGRKAYLSSVDLEFDAGMIYPIDVMYADIVDGAILGKVLNSTTASVTLSNDKIVSASVTVAAGATVNIPVGTYKDGSGKEVKVTKDKITTIA